MLDKLRGRQANEASWAWNLVKTLAQFVAFWTIFVLYIPDHVFRFERSIGIGYLFLGTNESMVGGVATLVVGSLFGLVSAVIMAVAGRGTPLPLDAARTLVLAGPYRFVRNPMAIAGGLQVLGIGLTIGSVTTLALAIAGLVVWNEVIRPWEERDLLARFGDSYAAYRDAVPCWIPRLTPYQPSL